MDENIKKDENNFEMLPIPVPAPKTISLPEPTETTAPPEHSYRKSGLEEEFDIQNHMEAPVTDSVQEYYAKSAKEQGERRKTGSKFNRFVAMVLILCTIGAPFAGLGFAVGIRLFDNFFITRLLDDSAERNNFSFQNTHSPMANPQGHGFIADYAELAQMVKPSVVLITATGGMPANFLLGPGQSAGSGILMYETSTRYYIATNAHVIEGAREVFVSIAGSDEIPAVPVGRDDDADLAVIAIYKAEAVARGVTSVTIASFGDSDAMLVGNVVLAIGNSMGAGNTVTNGIISALERDIFVAGRQLEVLQTNAAINRGNSGGPLVNIHGEVIGINTAKFTETLAEAMGYAIPSNIAMPILERLMHEHDSALHRRPMIGVNIATLNDEISEELIAILTRQGISPNYINLPEQGVVVTTVGRDTPASRAGLRVYDIITAIDGVQVATNEDLIDIFSTMNAGDQVVLSIIRYGHEIMDINVTLGPNMRSF